METCARVSAVLVQGLPQAAHEDHQRVAVGGNGHITQATQCPGWVEQALIPFRHCLVHHLVAPES